MYALNVYDEMKHLLIRLDKEYNSTLVRVYGNLGLFSEVVDKFREMETCRIKINSKLQCNNWGIWKKTSMSWLQNYLMTWKQDTKSYIIKYFIFYSFGIMIFIIWLGLLIILSLQLRIWFSSSKTWTLLIV